ncbi:MAG: hypothetical protein R6U96_12745 [Promethearchaeia archaeon]
MESIIYKVIFKKKDHNDEQPIDLRFKKVNAEKELKIPSKIIYKLRELTEIKENFVYIQNIKRILNIKSGSLLKNYKQFLVILFISKEEEKKGFLLGGNKEGTFKLLGVWPFNAEIKEQSRETYHKILTDIQKNPHLYSKICIIT